MEIFSQIWVTVTSLGLALFSLVLAIYFYIKTRQVKKLSYDIVGLNIIADSDDVRSDLKIQYRESDVTTLSITYMAIWNSGNVVIDGSDNSAQDPLRIETSNGNRILDAVVVRNSNPSCAIRLIVNHQGYAELAFEFLNPIEGGTLRLVHTDKNSTELQLKGSLRGLKGFRRHNLIQEIIPLVVALLISVPSVLILKTFQDQISAFNIVGLLIIFITITVFGGLFIGISSFWVRRKELFFKRLGFPIEMKQRSAPSPYPGAP